MLLLQSPVPALCKVVCVDVLVVLQMRESEREKRLLVSAEVFFFFFFFFQCFCFFLKIFFYFLLWFFFFFFFFFFGAHCSCSFEKPRTPTFLRYNNHFGSFSSVSHCFLRYAIKSLALGNLFSNMFHAAIDFSNDSAVRILLRKGRISSLSCPCN